YARLHVACKPLKIGILPPIYRGSRFLVEARGGPGRAPADAPAPRGGPDLVRGSSDAGPENPRTQGGAMTLHEMATRIGRVEALDRMAGPLARAAHRVVPPGPVKDVLSGAPIGHPLHPALTDVPVGSFTAATILDL